MKEAADSVEVKQKYVGLWHKRCNDSRKFYWNTGTAD